MDLYDVKARGFHSPLNAREISQLYRAGYFGSRQPCKPVGEAKWLTVDEVFPLLKIEATLAPYRMEEPKRGLARVPRRVRVSVVLLLASGAFFFWPKSPSKQSHPTVAAVPATNVLPVAQGLPARPLRTASLYPLGPYQESASNTARLEAQKRPSE